MDLILSTGPGNVVVGRHSSPVRQEVVAPEIGTVVAVVMVVGHRNNPAWVAATTAWIVIVDPRDSLSPVLEAAEASVAVVVAKASEIVAVTGPALVAVVAMKYSKPEFVAPFA